ncbi:MAG: hypothetical protein HC893_07240, partial [Chloroflexaceae bacterium]|nr:hypothetical protein [Chloroflexaceae bacterium]
MNERRLAWIGIILGGIALIVALGGNMMMRKFAYNTMYERAPYTAQSERPGPAFGDEFRGERGEFRGERDGWHGPGPF